ncbi:hypothetical protein AHIS1_p085 [Acaryochloris phage A-HIS1]|nr:hypothetical protein AHIS1_p085 [Acaryochloris phage A-HIS1]
MLRFARLKHEASLTPEDRKKRRERKEAAEWNRKVKAALSGSSGPMSIEDLKEKLRNK